MAEPRKLTIEVTPQYSSWLHGLRDQRARLIIAGRSARLAGGNLGDFKMVGDGVGEIRIDHGPGYRLYFTRFGDTVVLLLCGGDKSTQSADINRAKALARSERDARNAQ